MTLSSRWLHLQGATGEPRTERFMGREHIVVPTVMLVEGVVWPVTSDEAEFVPGAVLGVAPAQWDGSPVLTNHPAMEGHRVNGNDPRILEAMQFGTTFGTGYANKKLYTEAWLDPERAQKIGKNAVRYLERIADKTDQIEVSVGVFVVGEEREGEYKGEKYQFIWREAYRDHLAFLPEGTEGACNAEMGCGAMRTAMRHLVTAQGIIKERTNATKSLTGRNVAERWRRIALAHALSQQQRNQVAGGREPF